MKALIPAAGLGTRFLPVTSVIPKEMLPIGSRPALELIVDEARSAGATEIVIIISEGKELIRRYFAGQDDVKFVYQHGQKGLGHAVLQASGRFGDEQLLILLGDALVTGCNASKSMAEVSAANSGCSVIGCERVPRERVSRYGIMKPSSGAEIAAGNAFALFDIVEKPPVEEAPSDLAVAGRYLLDSRIFAYLADQAAGVGGEIQLTDAMRVLAKEQGMVGREFTGTRYDMGNKFGILQAIVQVALQHPEVKDQFRDYLKQVAENL